MPRPRGKRAHRTPNRAITSRSLVATSAKVSVVATGKGDEATLSPHPQAGNTRHQGPRQANHYGRRGADARASNEASVRRQVVITSATVTGAAMDTSRPPCSYPQAGRTRHQCPPPSQLPPPRACPSRSDSTYPSLVPVRGQGDAPYSSGAPADDVALPEGPRYSHQHHHHPPSSQRALPPTPPARQGRSPPARQSSGGSSLPPLGRPKLVVLGGEVALTLDARDPIWSPAPLTSLGPRYKVASAKKSHGWVSPFAPLATFCRRPMASTAGRGEPSVTVSWQSGCSCLQRPTCARACRQACAATRGDGLTTGTTNSM